MKSSSLSYLIYFTSLFFLITLLLVIIGSIYTGELTSIGFLQNLLFIVFFLYVHLRARKALIAWKKAKYEQ